MISPIFSILCTFLLALIAGASANSVPFNATLIGKKFQIRTGLCYYPRSNLAEVTLTTSKVLYRPNIFNDNRGPGYQGIVFCEGYTELYFRRHPQHMYILKLPEATHPFNTGDPNLKLPTCSELQKPEFYWPWGPTRAGFVTAFQDMMQGVVNIRDANQECKLYTESVSPVVDFLFTVAYDYYITV